MCGLSLSSRDFENINKIIVVPKSQPNLSSLIRTDAYMRAWFHGLTISFSIEAWFHGQSFIRVGLDMKDMVR